MKRLQEGASFLCTEMFGFCDGLEKTGGEVCSVFDIGDFLGVFN